MKLLPRILNRIVFIRAEFAQDGTCRTEVFVWRRDGLVPADRSAAKNTLTAVVVCGHGVVAKPDRAEITTRVKADSQTFLWSTACGETSFARRERLKALSEELAGEGIVPVRFFCDGTGADFRRTADEFARQLYTGLRWRSLLRPTAESSAAAQVLVRRAALPVLGAFLCLLAANALLRPRLNTRRQALQQEIAARERSASTAASAGARQRELLAAFAVRPRTPRAVVCDRIGGAVPKRVVLTSLQIEPLTKRFEAGKPLHLRERLIVVCGKAPAASDVSAFVGRLSELDCCRAVRLASVEKERDGDGLDFRIETFL